MRVALGLVAALMSALALGGGAGAKSSPTAFLNYSLAGTPPNPAGTACPGSSLCFNGAAEPAIRATPDGQFYASSENGLGAGTLALALGRQRSALLEPPLAERRFRRR
jgi:hypothetical protein